MSLIDQDGAWPPEPKLPDVVEVLLEDLTPESLAQLFHAAHVKHAAAHGFARPAPWAELSNARRGLVLAVAAEVRAAFLGGDPCP